MTGWLAPLAGVSVVLADFAAAFGVALVTTFGAALLAVFADLAAGVAVGLVAGFATGFTAGLETALVAGFAVALEAARTGFAAAFIGLPVAFVGLVAVEPAFFEGVFTAVLEVPAAVEPTIFLADAEPFEPALFAGAFDVELFAGTDAFFVATVLAGFAAGFDAAGFFAAGFVLFAAVFFVFFAAIIVNRFRDSEKKVEINWLLLSAQERSGMADR